MIEINRPATNNHDEQIIREAALHIAAKRLGERTSETATEAISELIIAADRLADWIRGAPLDPA